MLVEVANCWADQPSPEEGTKRIAYWINGIFVFEWDVPIGSFMLFLVLTVSDRSGYVSHIVATQFLHQPFLICWSRDSCFFYN